jgi:histidine triad (HIT) family protein
MNDCVFCKIIRGELSSNKVYEDERTLAFLDIHPIHPGHTLVIPKNTECQTIFDISAEDWAAVSETVRKVAIAVEKAMNADGINLMMNNRVHAGQVVDHPHVHIIPRFKADGLRQWSHSLYKDGEIATIGGKIRTAL